MDEVNQGALVVFVGFLLLGLLVCAGELPKQSPRYCERKIARCEYKIEFAQKEKKAKRLEQTIKSYQWYLERAEWKQEWKEREPD